MSLPVMAAILNLPLIPMSESVHTSSAVLADLENVGVASEISLLTHVETEILHHFICNSGNGGHLRFTTYPDIGKYLH